MKNKFYLKSLTLIVCSLFLFSCKSSSKDEKKHESQVIKKKNPVANSKKTAIKHNLSKPHKDLPSIDCPLHKAGVNPKSIKPFKATEKYIAFLNRKDRQKWQKPEDVIKFMNIKGSEKIADIGAGSGYFSFRFLKYLKTGKVFALDIDPGMIRHIHHNILTKGLKNITAILTKPGNPDIPKDMDIVFICNVLHHVKDLSSWMKSLALKMKKGARLVIIEFREGKLPQGPPAKLKIPLTKMMPLITAAGYTLRVKNSKLLPYQYYLEFVKN